MKNILTRTSTIVAALAFGMSGCAFLRQTGIQPGTDTAKIPVVKCKLSAPAVATVSSMIDVSTVTFSAAVLGSENLPSSALSIGKQIIRSAAATRTRGFAAPADVSAAQAFASTLGVDLTQFAEDVDLVDAPGADDADKAIQYQLSLIDKARTTGTVAIKPSEWVSFGGSVAKATASTGWTASFARSLGQLTLDHRGSNGGAMTPLAVAEVGEAKRKWLIAAYMKAYFRNGEVFDLQYLDDNLKAKLDNEIEKQVSDTSAQNQLKGSIDGVLGQFRSAVCKKGASASGSCDVLGVIGQQTFVTRTGKSYGFPGITATIDPVAAKKVSTNKLSTDDIIEDLVRVTFEASADSLSELPGTSNSTLCLTAPARCVSSKQSATLTAVFNVGDATEGSTEALVAAIIRGGWLFSLNNEALAKSITIASGVVARKITEEAAWNKASANCAPSPATPTSSTDESTHDLLSIRVAE